MILIHTTHPLDIGSYNFNIFFLQKSATAFQIAGLPATVLFAAVREFGYWLKVSMTLE